VANYSPLLYRLYFLPYVEIPRMRIGKRQTSETLISEEAYLFARYLRNEIGEWNPRIVTIQEKIGEFE
jgi:hypothetical protein